MLDGHGQGIGQCVESIAGEGGEGGEGSAVSDREPDVERNRLFVGVVLVSIMPRFALSIRGRGRGAEEALVLGQETQDEASRHVGPENGGLDGGARVIRQGLEAQAGKGTQDGEED